MPNYNLTYCSILESGDEFYQDCQRILVENDIDPAVQKRFLVSVSEAFTNALIHGNRLDSGKNIKIRLEINQKALSADIIDEGKGGLDKILNRIEPDLLSDGGRGIKLMKHFSSETKFQQLAHGLKVTVILKREPNSQEQIV